jgi:hypothetical protein
MLNIYNYHATPEKLPGFAERWSIDPMLALEVLKKDPSNKKAERIVLTDYRAVLAYVSNTGKAFPAGLKVLMARNDIMVLIDYAILIKQRVPQIEQRLLATDYYTLINRYISNVIEGPWKEAEAVLAKSEYHAREYVRMWLGGDWAKFDRGQRVDKESWNWQDYVKEIIDDIVQGINENQLDLYQDEDDDDIEEWKEVHLTYKPEGKRLIILKGTQKVGSVELSGKRLEFFDDDNEMWATMQLTQPQDEAWDSIYDFVDRIIGI